MVLYSAELALHLPPSSFLLLSRPGFALVLSPTFPTCLRQPETREQETWVPRRKSIIVAVVVLLNALFPELRREDDAKIFRSTVSLV